MPLGLLTTITIIFVLRMSTKHKACMHNALSAWALSMGVVMKANKKELFVTLVDELKPVFRQIRLIHWP